MRRTLAGLAAVVCAHAHLFQAILTLLTSAGTQDIQRG